MGLFSPKWKSKNSDNRKAWIAKADIRLEKNIDILKQLAENDHDIDVKQLAEKRLDEHYNSVNDNTTENEQKESNELTLVEMITGFREGEVEEYFAGKGNANIQNRDGNTILMRLCKIAANNGADLTCQLIDKCIKKGADLNIKNNDGDTALILAMRSPSMGEYDVVTVVKHLIENGADVNVMKVEKIGDKSFEYKYNEVLLTAKATENVELYNLLVRAGAQEQTQDENVEIIQPDSKDNDGVVWEDNKNGTFIDPRDGKKYKVVKIGNQIWMAENLAYEVSRGCWAYGNDQNNVAKYGYLYNFKTAENICPSGWHLPSDEELTELINYLGGEDVAGKKLKSATGWETFNKGENNGNNESGFSALPGGIRYDEDGSFEDAGKVGYWWSSTPETDETALEFHLDYDSDMVHWYDDDLSTGCSVRCIKD